MLGERKIILYLMSESDGALAVYVLWVVKEIRHRNNSKLPDPDKSADDTIYIYRSIYTRTATLGGDRGAIEPPASVSVKSLY